MQSPPGPYTLIDGRRYLYFAGTGYLGLQSHPDVIRAVGEAAEQYGIGSATSRRGFGNTPPVLEVERRAAEFFGTDEAFYFMSGYVANHILTLASRDAFDVVFLDEWSHYCVAEAAQLADKPVIRFRHADPEDLREKLRADLPPGGRPLVMTDGVFTGRGNVAPVAEYRAVLEDFPGGAICVDDAHGVGVLGSQGRGTYDAAGMFDRRVNDEIGTSDDTRLLLCGTLSKAVGGFGGIMPGSRAFIDRLKASSTYHNGASAPPVPIAAATARALQMMIDEPQMRQRLWRNVAAVKNGLRGLGLAVDDTPVPIVCLVVGDAANMRRIHGELMQREIIVPYLAAYSGIGVEGALRLAVFATHTDKMIARLLDELRRLL